MSEIDIEINPNFYAGYFPEKGEFSACVDASGYSTQLEEAIYDRVRHWTALHGIILGEGYSWHWTTERNKYINTLSLCL